MQLSHATYSYFSSNAETPVHASASSGRFGPIALDYAFVNGIRICPVPAHESCRPKQTEGCLGLGSAKRPQERMMPRAALVQENQSSDTASQIGNAVLTHLNLPLTM